MDNSLQKLRNEIDQIDTQIITLLAKRMKVVRKIGDYKKEHDLLALDTSRWEEVLKKIQEEASTRELDQVLVVSIWNLIHKKALEIEQQ